MKIMYELYTGYGIKITPVQVERETEKCVFVRTNFPATNWRRGSTRLDRRNKRSDDGGYYDTWEEARDKALEVAEQRLHDATRRTTEAEKERDTIKG